MKKCLSFAFIMIHGVSNGTDIALSWKTPLAFNNNSDTNPEIATLVKETAAMSADDIEGIENILGAFAQMISSFAHVMVNPNNPAAAAAGISAIVTNAFKVILELAKHKNHLIDPLPYEYFPIRGGNHNAHYTLEAMEKELMAKQYDSEFDPSTQAILTTFAGMVGNFANIVADPHNPNVLGSNIANLLAGMINIAVQANKSGKLTAYSTPEDLHNALMHDELMHALTAIVQQHAARARLLRLSTGYHDTLA